MWKPETTFSRFWIVRENWERKLNANDVVDLLNEQHEQIERLKDNFRVLDEVKCELADEKEQLKRNVQYWYAEHKRIVNNYVDKIKEVEKENEQLKRENKELNKLCVTYGFEMGKLEEENEQLKQYNTELITKIDFLERIIDGDME